MENKMKDSKREELRIRIEELVGEFVYREDGDLIVDIKESLLDFIDSEISKAKEEVLETAKEIIDGKSIYSNNGCGTPLELLDWFIESELDKLSKKNKCSGK